MCPAAAFPPGTQGWPRADTGWASPVPVLWTAAVGAARPSTAPAELRPNEGPARPGLPRDRPPPILGVSRHRCLLPPLQDWAGGLSASRETAAGGGYGAAAAAARALTESAARGPRAEPYPAQPAGARPPSETPLKARAVTAAADQGNVSTGRRPTGPRWLPFPGRARSATSLR